MRTETSAFAQDYGLDEDTTAALFTEVEGMHETFTTVREDASSGTISWFDARTEFRALRDESEARLVEILGQETYEAYEERVLPRGRRGRL